jgi:hypothetical protein
MANQRTREEQFLLMFLVVLTIYHIVARFGLAVDLQWHTDIGRDKLLTPPHLMIFAGLIPTTLFLVIYILRSSFYGWNEERIGLQFGPFIAPVSVWMISSGMITLLLGGLYDDYWHASYGVDTTIITPPHVWTFAGGMLVESGTLVLGLELRHKLKATTPHWMNVALLGTLWALVYHFHLAFANFLDPRVSTLAILDLELILHFMFTGAVLLTFLPLADRLLGEKGAIRLSAVMLGSQILFLILVPFLVSTFMTEEHFYRPGAPHTTYAANCLPWLLLPGVLIIKRYSMFENAPALIALALIVDVAWLPTFIEHTPVKVGVVSSIFSIVVSAVALFVVWPLTQAFGDAIERLARPISVEQVRSKRTGGAPSTLVVLLLFTIAMAPMASGHSIHLTEEGDGFDAPKRFLIDVNDTYVWVEFMMWPPKAQTNVEVTILPAENESVVIEFASLDIVYPGERGEVKMRTEFANRGGYGLWEEQVYFSFSGEQTMQIVLTVNGEEASTDIPVEVDGPPSLPIWLAWTLALGWPCALIGYWRSVSHSTKRKVVA